MSLLTQSPQQQLKLLLLFAMKFACDCMYSFQFFLGKIFLGPFFFFSFVFFLYLKRFRVEINFLSFLVSFFLFTYSFSVVLSFLPFFLSVCMSVFPSFLFRLSFAIFKSPLRSLSRMYLLGFQRIHLLILSIYRHYNPQKYPDQQYSIHLRKNGQKQMSVLLFVLREFFTVRHLRTQLQNT